MYKVLMLNKISPKGTSVFDDKYDLGEFENPDAVILRSASMHEMQLPETLLGIARAGAGTNNIPIDKCSQNGIVVFNTPGANANAVKELVICGLLLSCRKVAAGAQWADSLAGEGENVGKLVEKGKSNFAGPEIMGKTLGIIGAGAIGRLVANAAAALGMNVICYDAFAPKNISELLAQSVRVADSMEEIRANSDFISVHVPLNDGTRSMIDRKFLSGCKDGVRILNFARGPIVNSDDIVEALESGKVAAYVVDFPDDKVLGKPGVTALPHLGASTPESEENCAKMAAEQLRLFLEYGSIKNSVNMPDICLKDIPGTVTTVFAEQQAKDEINRAAGDEVKSVSKNGYIYMGFAGDVSGKLGAVDSICKIRVIEK